MTQTFDPYGNSYAYSGPTEPLTNVGFTGEQTDSNGLVFLRARYYAPSMGRFMNMDPSRQERNPYQYALGNPIMLTDPSGLCSSGECNASSASASNLSINLDIAIPPELMALFGDCVAEQDVKDFFNGILDQLKLDMALQPYNMAINFIAHLQPPPGLGFEKYPLSAVSNLATNTRAEAERLNAKFWNGSGWYKTGRLVGRVISTGIALVLAFDGPLTIGIGITGEGLSIACEVASLGMCSAVAGGGVVVSTALVITGAAEMAYGAAVVWANAANPVGGKGGAKDFKKKCQTAHKHLTDYERLYEKVKGRPMAPATVRKLNALRDASPSRIRGIDLPADLREKFPGEWLYKTLDELAKICGKNWR